MKSYRWRRGAAAAVAVVCLAPAFAAGQEVPVAAVERPGVLTLEDALRMALSRSRDLEDARLAYRNAEAQVREAWGSVYPTMDLSATFVRNLSVPTSFVPAVFFDPDAPPDQLVPVQFGADNQWNFAIRAEQTVFQASVFLGLSAAERYRALQREGVRGRAHQVATRVRLAYYDVLLAQEAMRLNEESVRRVRKVLDETRAMNRAGLAADYDVLRLEVELANLEPNVRRARNAVAAAKRALAVELAVESLDSVEVAGSLAAMDLVTIAENDDANRGVLRFAGLAEAESEAEEVVQLALAHRSDLRQLELLERLRATEVRVERSEYLPRISVFGSYSIAAQENGAPEFFGEPGARAYGRQVGVQVSLPLFAGFKRPARVAQRQAALRQVQAQYRLAAARAETEVRTLLDQVEEARARAQAQRQAVSQARRGFEIASAQYREGIGSQLEVTDAEVALRQSEFNYAEAVYDYLAARARLDEATGMVPLTEAVLTNLALER